MCVCLSAHASLAVRTIKSMMKDTIVLSVGFAAILKNVVFLKIILFDFIIDTLFKHNDVLALMTLLKAHNLLGDRPR